MKIPRLLWQADPDAHEAVLGRSTLVQTAWAPHRAVAELEHRRAGTGRARRRCHRSDARSGRQPPPRRSVRRHVRCVPHRCGSGVVGRCVVRRGRRLGGRRRERRALAELTEIPRDNADLLAYGYVKRGWAVSAARLDDSLAHDWPEGPHYRPLGIGFTAEAFEDLYAPDAFAVQLLGPSYESRIPEGVGWRRAQVGIASVLLEHVDLRVWFDSPLGPFRYRAKPTELPQPPALAEARVELAPILYSPGILARLGYARAEA